MKEIISNHDKIIYKRQNYWETGWYWNTCNYRT